MVFSVSSITHRFLSHSFLTSLNLSNENHGLFYEASMAVRWLYKYIVLILLDLKQS